VLSIPADSPFSWKSIWRVRVPSRVALFGWMVALGKILTLDNLRKGNVMVVDCCCLFTLKWQENLVFDCLFGV
jgi:hypothetical protein